MASLLTSINSDEQVKSFPTLRETVRFQSYHTNKVVKRSFEKTSVALYNVGVIIRALAKREEADQVEEMIQEHLKKMAADLKTSIAQCEKLALDAGITELPEYSAPQEYHVMITSPEMSILLRLLKQMDVLMSYQDALWFHAIFSSRQHSDAGYEWQRRMIKMCNRIMAIEKRARAASYRRQTESGETVVDESELMTSDANDIAEDADDLLEQDLQAKPSPKTVAA